MLVTLPNGPPLPCERFAQFRRAGPEGSLRSVRRNCMATHPLVGDGALLRIEIFPLVLSFV